METALSNAFHQNRTLTFRIAVETTARMNAGNHTHINSLFKTSQPRLLKNALIPIGETAIGVQGKKYLSLLIGENNAIPSPPLVKASRIPWLAISKKKKIKKKNHLPENSISARKKNAVTKRLNINAKKGEWKNPLCPK